MWLGKWSAYTAAKESMLRFTDTDITLWTAAKGNGKKCARIYGMKYVLSLFDYGNKVFDPSGTVDPLVVGRARGSNWGNNQKIKLVMHR